MVGGGGEDGAGDCGCDVKVGGVEATGAGNVCGVDVTEEIVVVVKVLTRVVSA